MRARPGILEKNKKSRVLTAKQSHPRANQAVGVGTSCRRILRHSVPFACVSGEKMNEEPSQSDLDFLSGLFKDGDDLFGGSSSSDAKATASSSTDDTKTQQTPSLKSPAFIELEGLDPLLGIQGAASPTGAASPVFGDGQLGGSSNPLAGSQAQLKEMRKQRKNIREKKRREEIAAKIEQLGQMLSMSEKERGEKQAVLVATLRAIETLRAQNAHLRGQKHKLSNHLKHLTSSLQKAFPAAQPAAQPAAGGSPTIDTSSLTELFMAPTPGPSMAEAAQRGARPISRVESMGVENGSGNFDFTSL